MSEALQSAGLLLAKSAAAYKTLPAFQGRFSLTLAEEKPLENGPPDEGSKSGPETASIAYSAGAGTDASFLTGGYGATASGSNIYLTQDTHPGVYIIRKLDRDLAASLDRLLGHTMFLPPQLVFRSQNDPDAWMQALGFGLIGNLSPLGTRSGIDASGRKTDIAEFQGTQGRIFAVFDNSSAHLLEASLFIADRAYTFSVEEETSLPPDTKVIFDPSGRQEIASFSGFSGTAAQVGSPAPVTLFKTLDGQDWTLATGKGRWQILDFWALWCAPCLAAMPDLDSFFHQLTDQDFPADLWTVALVDNETKTDSFSQINALWHGQGYRLPVLIDEDGLRARDIYSIRSIPAMVVVDPSGIVRHMGPGLSLTGLKTMLGFPKDFPDPAP